MNGRQLINELRTRGVYRAAVIYTAGAWALLQFADIGFPLIGVAEGGVELVLMVAAAGFPVAMIFAWFYDLTSHGLVEAAPTNPKPPSIQWTPLRVFEVVLVLALTLLVGFLYAERLASNGYQSPTSEVMQPDRPSVAVLPFVNMSADEDLDYFGDGLAEEILNLLARVDALDVTARTSSFYFKDKSVDIPTIANHLGVNHILEGSLRIDADLVRVTVQLIETGTGFHLWSNTYERQRGNTFSLQDEIAMAVARQLEVQLTHATGASAAKRNIDAGAFDYYLRGRDYLRRVADETGLHLAEQMFKSALEISPHYSDAHAGLCDTLLSRYRLLKKNDDYVTAEASCQRALQLDEEAFSTYTALGNLYRLSGKPQLAIEQFERALTLNPRAISAQVGIAETLTDQGEFVRAEQVLNRAIQQQPNFWPASLAIGNLQMRQGKAALAVSHYERINELLPDNSITSNNLGSAYYLAGRFEEAVTIWRSAANQKPSVMLLLNLGSSYFFLRDFEQAAANYTKVLNINPENFEAWGNLADAQYFLGDREQARSSYASASDLATEALAVQPQDALTRAMLAHYQARLANAEQARRQLARAAYLSSDDVYINYFAATALATLGDVEAATRALDRAIQHGYYEHLVQADANLDRIARDTINQGVEI